MYQRILVAYDGSAESRLAVDECAHLSPSSEREVHVVCVIHDPSAFVLQADLDIVAAGLSARGFQVTTHLIDGEPADVLSRLVTELAIDLLVIGHRRAAKFAARWWRGRVDALLMERVNCAILIAGGAPAAKRSR
jgi:nucleotide-binding universal stress UspA family protein